MLEIIAFNVESCKIIDDAGGDRIELCAGPAEGGTTPSYGFMSAARRATTLPIFPIIRPRGGDFVYTREEFDSMLQDIVVAKELGMNGIVSGCLSTCGEVDKSMAGQIVKAAHPLPAHFHRAFDRVQDQNKSLEEIINLGFKCVLTSGGRPTVDKGSEQLARLVEQAGDRIVVMPGSGVSSNNIAALFKATGAKWFHSSARISFRDLNVFNPAAMEETTSYVMADADEIKKLTAALSAVINKEA